MAEEIKVIVTDKAASDINKLSETEREIIFNTLAEENPDIPRVHFEAFADGQTELLKYDNRHTKPGIVELLLRKLVEISTYLSAYSGYVLVPVVRDFKVPVVMAKSPKELSSTALGGDDTDDPSTDDISVDDAAADADAPAITGGVVAKQVKAFRQLKQQQKSQRELDPKVIRARFDHVVYSVTTRGQPYLIPPGEEVDVLGVKLYKICEPLVLDDYDSYKLSNFDRVQLGVFTPRELAMQCQLFDNLNLKEIPENRDEIIVIEANTPAVRQLNDLFEYLSFLDTYLTSPEASHYIYRQLAAAATIERGKKPMAFIKKELQSLFIGVRRPIYNLDPGFANPFPPAQAEFLKFIEGLAGCQFSQKYALSTHADLFSMGLASLFYSSVLYGKDSKRVKEITGQIQARKSRLQLQSLIRQRQIQALYRLNVYKLIIEKKLGTPRYLEIIRAYELAPADILTLLKPAERKLVELEFERRQKYLEEVVNNKCPHVRTLRKFRYYKFDYRAKKTFEEVRKFMAKKTAPDQIIKCNNCNFDLICPHLIDYTELVFQDRTFNEIKMKMTKYIDNAIVASQYFCKICGEVLADVDVYGSVVTDEEYGVSQTISDDLRKTMDSEMFVAAKQVDFGPLINIPRLISSMRAATYEYIFEAEKQLLKSKTNTAEDVKNKKRLFITIYAYAYLIHLMLSNKSKDKATAVAFKGMKASTSPKDYAKHAIGLIINTKNIVIKQIANLTNEFIAKKLIEAYQNIASRGAVSVQTVGEMENLYNILQMDPLYHYVYWVLSLDKKKFSREETDLQDKISTYLGITETTRDVKTDPFLNVKPLDAKRWHADKFDSLTPVVKGQIFSGKGANKIDIATEAIPGYIMRSFEMVMTRIRNRLFEKFMYNDYEVSKLHREYFEASSKLLSQERLFLDYQKMFYARVHYGDRPAGNQQYQPKPIPLGKLYDEDGKAHVWGVYIYGDKEVKLDEITKGIDGGKPIVKAPPTDRKCTVCGKRQSEVATLNEKKIRASLLSRSTIGNFFKFYESRCPAGGLHEFGTSNEAVICKKCGLDFNMIYNVESAAALEYFRKYESNYHSEVKSAGAMDMTVVQYKPPEDLSRFDKQYAKWAFNYNTVLDLAGKLKIAVPNLFTCLAATERIEYTSIISGAYIPNEADTRDDTRIFVLDSYIKTLITDYNNIRYFYTFSRPPIDIAKLLEEFGGSKHEYHKLESLLPNIYDEYYERLKWFRDNKKPREIVEFLIETFAQKCLQIYGDKTNETRKIREAFVRYIVAKVIRIDELNSKAGEFNRNLLYPDEKVDQDVGAVDPNFDEDAGLENEDDLKAEQEGDEEYGLTDEPLKNNFDIDTMGETGEVDPDENGYEDNDVKVEGYEDLQ